MVGGGFGGWEVGREVLGSLGTEEIWVGRIVLCEEADAPANDDVCRIRRSSSRLGCMTKKWKRLHNTAYPISLHDRLHIWVWASAYKYFRGST